MTESEGLAWLATLFDEPVGQFGLGTRREHVEAWDSLGVLTLMAGLDSEFGINLDDEAFQKIETAGDVLEILRNNGILS